MFIDSLVKKVTTVTACICKQNSLYCRPTCECYGSKRC